MGTMLLSDAILVPIVSSLPLSIKVPVLKILVCLSAKISELLDVKSLVEETLPQKINFLKFQTMFRASNRCL